jgi:hypothetical protein
MTNFDDIIKKYPLTYKNAEVGTFWECPEGWVDILDKMSAEIEEILKDSYASYPPTESQPGICVEQIKEKFGGLRFYYLCISDDEKLWDKVSKVVEKYETMSYNICQNTGNTGELCKNGGWFMTLS